MCHGLTTGEKYVFHVRAVNAAGISEFSQESEAIEVKAAIGELAQLTAFALANVFILQQPMTRSMVYLLSKRPKSSDFFNGQQYDIDNFPMCIACAHLFMNLFPALYTQQIYSFCAPRHCSTL